MKSERGIVLNEDSCHFFATRTRDEMSAEGLRALIEQYRATQVREIFFNVNAQTTSYASEVWDPVWRGFDPCLDEHQPVFQTLNEDAPGAPANWRKQSWEFVRNALLLHEQGIDPYAVWLERSRELGISPWLSMRMNDIHGLDIATGQFINSTFWKNRPDLRRAGYCAETALDRAFDYGKQEVRDYHFALIRELVERYELDGLELDWMRFPYHFRPGYELEDGALLTAWLREVSSFVRDYAGTSGRRIELAVRVPSHPLTSHAMGLDAVEWARQGLVDRVTASAFYTTADMDIPIELWRERIGREDVVLAAGMDHNFRPGYTRYRVLADAALTFGAAASFFHRGADRLYLFNFMDSGTTVNDPATDYRTILRNAGEPTTIAGHVRRHAVTFPDTRAPGTPVDCLLPATCAWQQRPAFRIHTGPKPDGGSAYAVIGYEDESVDASRAVEVWLNGEACRADTGDIPSPTWDAAGILRRYEIPLNALKDGYNLLEAANRSGETCTIVWAEIVIAPQGSATRKNVET